MRKIMAYVALTLVLALLVLVLASWLLSATVGGGIRSMLSAEGIRFFCGGFCDMLQKPLLIWLLLLFMAWGCVQRSGLTDILCRKEKAGGRVQRRHLLAVMIIVAVSVGIVLLLTCMPHAVLLSATGGLWPSPFSSALVPMVALCTIVAGVAYGLLERRFTTVIDIFSSLSDGIAQCAPWLVLYVLAMQLVDSFRFVFLGL